MSEALKKVGLIDIARGALQLVPEAQPLLRGVLRLATLRPNSHNSIGAIIEHWARETPDNIALEFEGQRWTYGEFNTWANRIAGVFRANGIKSGDTVGLLMENRPELLACVAGAVKLGAIAAMLNHNQRNEVLTHSIGLVKPKLLVVSAESEEAIKSTIYTPKKSPDLSFFWLGGDERKKAPKGWTDLDLETRKHDPRNPGSTSHVKANQPCYYIFTSGTTGMPKASIMTHYRWMASLAGVGGATLRLRQDDIFYCCLPLYHNNALTVSWSSVLSAGATLALDRKFSASRFWDRIRYYEATAFCYIGELLRYLLNQPASPSDAQHKVRVITGNGLRPELWAAFEKRFAIERICEFYGASESNIAFINVFGVRQTAGFTPLPFAIVRFDQESEEPIRDGKGFMSRVGKGETGLLISEVSERRPFDGYTDPKAGEKKLFRNVFKNGDVWFNSGDLVRDQGWHHIQFVDRVGDTFRWKGENVATSEVEAAFAHEHGLEHAVVYGVTVPNADGRAGMCAVSLKHGTTLDGSTLAQHLARKLPAYAIPLFLRIRPEQETTGTFKYRKVDLKNAGFDPSQIEEPLYVLLDREKGYEVLTPAIFDAISSGKIRL